MTRKSQLIALSFCVVIGICSLMAMAVAWGPKQECIVQFPKIVGCALGSYEGLSAGLIATGGALIAGWLAWSAARDQIWLARRQSAENFLVSIRGKLVAAEYEIKRLNTAKLTMSQLHWDLTSQPGPMGAMKLVSMWKAQKFLTSSQDLATNSLGGQLWEAANRLRLLAQQIDSRLSTTSADVHPGILRESEKDAASAVETFIGLANGIDPYIAKQEAVIDSLKAELADAEARMLV
jgi:hypothetical protein